MTDTAAQDHAVRLAGIDMVFGSGRDRVAALDDVTLDIPQGAITSIVGRSGCGKSTLLRIVAGLVRPTRGEMCVMGQSTEDYQRGRRFGFVFQEASLLPWKTAAQNVALPLQVMGLAPGSVEERVARMLRLVRLEGFSRSYPAELSGGMRQRVSIARALSYEPEILLMDEPFGALDEFTRRELHQELIRIWSDRPLTVIFVTHSLGEAMALSDRVVAMSARPGRVREVVEVETPRDPSARRSPRHLAQLDRLEGLLDVP